MMLLGQADAISDVSPWAEYGLPGLVILAFFGLFYLVVRWAGGHINKQAESHREERSEWRKSNEQMQTEFRGTIERTSDNFSETVREILKR
ncbi:MAG: hypothetical protein AAFX06_25060 [Planctomycetota bacterium]